MERRHSLALHARGSRAPCTALGIAALLGARGARAASRLYVIGAGLPRTGSQSMMDALTRLGYKTAHGMSPLESQIWCDWLGGDEEFEPALRTIVEKNFTATLDQPATLAYKELLQRFPDAKVVLTLHEDADSWYDSLARHVTHWTPVVYNPSICNRLLLAFHPYSDLVGGLPLWKNLECAKMQAARYGCEGIYSDPESLDVRRECIDGYTRHNEEVRRVVPPSQLLVFELGSGWAPLCDFLRVPTPREPFPRHDVSVDLATALVGESCSLVVRASSKYWLPPLVCVCAYLFWCPRRRAAATAGPKKD